MPLVPMIGAKPFRSSELGLFRSLGKPQLDPKRAVVSDSGPPPKIHVVSAGQDLFQIRSNHHTAANV